MLPTLALGPPGRLRHFSEPYGAGGHEGVPFLHRSEALGSLIRGIITELLLSTPLKEKAA